MTHVIWALGPDAGLMDCWDVGHAGLLPAGMLG